MEGALQPHAYWMIAVFVIGYFFITIEHVIKIDKATIALLMGILCWVIQFTQGGGKDCGNSLTCLGEHISNISQIVFFLLGALVIVEMINVHKGFALISNSLHVSTKRRLLWTIGLLSFFLSAILDNLTTTIVMVTLLAKLIEKGEDRLIIGGAIVIAANAGGAWTPIGDVTTTMLWIGGQISTLAVMKDLFLPSIISLLIPLIFLSFLLKGDMPDKGHIKEKHLEPMGEVIFFLGLGSLIFVPIFKLLTGLPPFMGMLLGVSVMWLVTDIMHSQHSERHHLRVPSVVSRIDFSSLFFFLGILLAINAIESAGILKKLATWLDYHVSSTVVIATLIGLASAVVDNVPLVAASMGMYDMDHYSVDSPFWQLVAFCAGTGGSILIIGSAAGVVFMGLEKANFFWYLKRISLPALLGYFAGIGIYLLLS